MSDIIAIMLLILLYFLPYAGTYCPLGSERPIPCPAGKYCALHGLSLPSGLCKMGFFCNGSDVLEDPTPCAQGYYCPQGTPVQESCHPGTFNGKTTAERNVVALCSPWHVFRTLPLLLGTLFLSRSALLILSSDAKLKLTFSVLPTNCLNLSVVICVPQSFISCVVGWVGVLWCFVNVL